MKMYRVFLDDLSVSEREAAVEKLSSAAWDIYRDRDHPNNVAFKVAWDRQEDFESSSVFPLGCRCVFLGGEV